MDSGTRALGQLLGYPSCIYCNHRTAITEVTGLILERGADNGR